MSRLQVVLETNLFSRATQTGDYDAAHKHLQEIISRNADQPAVLAQAMFHKADMYARDHKLQEAIKGYQDAIAEHGKDLSETDLRTARSRLANYMKQAGDAAGMRKVQEEMLEDSSGQYAIQSETQIARSYAMEGNIEDAIATLRAIPYKHPLDLNYHRPVYEEIYKISWDNRRYAEALAAAKILYDTATTEKELQAATDSITKTLRAVDGHLFRVNSFLELQKYGPAGEDGKPGTQDDLQNPLAGVGEPVTPELESKRKEVIALIDGKKMSPAGKGRLKASHYLAWGMPREALVEYTRIYNNAPMKELQRAANDIATGLRALHGHPLAADAFFDYQNFGPAGKDGKKGTQDDLTNPLEEFK